MNEILNPIHSGLRWIILILLVLAIINAFSAKTFEKKHKMINLFAMIALHTQLLIGLVLLKSSGKVNFGEGWMKDSIYRFYGMEHLAGMVIAIALITFGYVKSKKGTTPAEIYKPIKLFYVIGLILILASIPWPFRANLGGAWF
ncbi:MAG: cytochrome B [Flavobacteriia bacterium]|nr:cytochrome B [Flavobacteriia bacterium]